jgi:hypothetical protein
MPYSLNQLFAPVTNLVVLPAACKGITICSRLNVKQLDEAASPVATGSDQSPFTPYLAWRPRREPTVSC